MNNLQKCLLALLPIFIFFSCAPLSFHRSLPSEDTLHSTPLFLSSPTTSHRHTYVTHLPIGEKVVLADLEGPAVINHIWMTGKSVIPQLYGLLVLRIWWDNEEEPSVEAPLGDLFGVGFGKEREFKSLLLEMFPAGDEHHASLNCYWQMPFRTGARIEVENRSNRTVTLFFIQVDYEKHPQLPEDTLYFHAQYRRENPVTRHVPYTILEAEGRGNYVGTVFNYHLLGPGAWVEGGQEFYIDGEQEPSLPGTGAEDYFGHAWGFRTENNALLHGTSFGPENHKMTAYRFHTPDPVRFTESIRATMRCHGWDVGDREDDYSSIALWYQSEPHAPFPAMPPVDYELLEVAEEFRKNPLDILSEKLSHLPFKGENLALKVKEYSESGHFDIDCTGDRAFDGDVGTKWCEIEHPDAHWLALDLGKPALIEGFVLKNPSAIGDSPGYDVRAFSIEKGDSLTGPWQQILEYPVISDDKTTTPTDTCLVILPLSPPLTARYLKLNLTRSSSVDAIARVQEFEVWGTTE